MRKITLIAIIVALLANSICFAFEDVNDSKVEEAVNILSKYFIINGYEDGTFRPNNSITRAEFTKIVIHTGNLFCQGRENVFVDTQGHWAEDYINMANSLEMVNGVTVDTFAPDAKITYEQAAKIIVCALGYGDDAAREGGYPSGYIKIAKSLGIFNGIKIMPSEFATRGNIAIMINNAIVVERKVFDESGNRISVLSFKEIQEEILQSNENDIETETDSVG